MRKFAFVVFDIENKITERFGVDLITGPSGLGFKLKLSTLEGDIVDTLTKVAQEKQSVGMTVNFFRRGYERYLILSQWLQKYSVVDSRMALEYDDGVQVRYMEGRVTNLGKTEIDEYNVLSCEATFTPLTPFFVNVENTIRISVSSIGKSYPFRYPYSYGKNVVENNRIENSYIADIPITVKITGVISEPTVLLLDENGNEYTRIRFPEVDLAEGQYIIINSATRKIWFFDGIVMQDYSAGTDPQHDTFLFAQRGISTISVNLASSDSGELTGSWRQYGL